MVLRQVPCQDLVVLRAMHCNGAKLYDSNEMNESRFSRDRYAYKGYTHKTQDKLKTRVATPWAVYSLFFAAV